MASIGEGLKSIFMAGIGAMAYTGEKGKELIDQLVEKGEITLEQGKELSEEFQRKAGKTATDLRNSALEARMRGMTPQERDEFVEAATKIAQTQNAEDAAAAAEAEPESEDAIEAEIVEEQPEGESSEKPEEQDAPAPDASNEPEQA